MSSRNSVFLVATHHLAQHSRVPPNVESHRILISLSVRVALTSQDIWGLPCRLRNQRFLLYFLRYMSPQVPYEWVLVLQASDVQSRALRTPRQTTQSVGPRTPTNRAHEGTCTNKRVGGENEIKQNRKANSKERIHKYVLAFTPTFFCPNLS